MKYDFVFIVLVYRNTEDLKEFFHYFTLKKTKVIVVNSFYDEASEFEFKKIANDNGAFFLSVPNKGYGAGNNRGIEYALANYNFSYLVISNADVIIKRMQVEDFVGFENNICAPDITDLKGIHQNPHMAFKKAKCFYTLRYWLQKHNVPGIILMSSIISRLNKNFFYICNYLFGKDIVYAAHGAFVIFPHSVISSLMPLYNEEMFLFGEELHVGLKAEKHKIVTKYLPNIKVIHKEDGSVSLERTNISKFVEESYEKIYEYWFKNKQ